MYDARRGSAGKLCSSNFNGKLPGEGGGSAQRHGGGCTVRHPAGYQWGTGRAGCPHHHPGGPRPHGMCGVPVTVTGWGGSRVWGQHRARSSPGSTGCTLQFPPVPGSGIALLPASVSPCAHVPPALLAPPRLAGTLDFLGTNHRNSGASRTAARKRWLHFRATCCAQDQPNAPPTHRDLVRGEPGEPLTASGMGGGHTADPAVLRG